jgi:hypothetical protein
MKANGFKCRRNLADVRVQMLAGLEYAILHVRDAANEDFSNAVPVYKLLTASIG